MPFESAVNILDCFFCDGAKVIFQITLAILEGCATKLAQCKDDGEAISVLTQFVDGVTNADIVDPILKSSKSVVGELGALSKQLTRFACIYLIAFASFSVG